jgi:acyl carrier protein
MSALPPHPRLLLAQALGVEPETLTDEAAMSNVPNWDSFTHLTFMMALESHFGVRLNDRSIAACKSLAGACRYLSEAGKNWQGR